jgi:3-dehydroquinate dehydratase-2
MIKLLVIHGPNLNLLGRREAAIYGKTTMKDIDAALKAEAERLDVSVDLFQSNHEGDIVDRIGTASVEGYRGILINPAAYTHTSVAIRDALLACSVPAVEVHLSNIYKREEFRHLSLTAPACVGQISGFGKASYILGLHALMTAIDGRKRKNKDPRKGRAAKGPTGAV